MYSFLVDAHTKKGNDHEEREVSSETNIFYTLLIYEFTLRTALLD